MSNKSASKYVYCYWGAGIALGIYGSHREVERAANSLFNFNVTDSAPIWLSEHEDKAFAYVLTTWERLKRGYTDVYLAAFQSPTLTKEALRRKHKGIPNGFMRLAKLKAEQRVATIQPESFLDHTSNPETFQVSHDKLEDVLNS